ncbi:MAG: DUF485 domain-containing protein [Sporichthyaceae bacterium]
MAQLDEPARSGQDAAHDEIYNSPEFNELRSRFRRLVFPLVAAFLAWYVLYVLTATYAREFMAEELVGKINVALVFGLLQFVSTFGIAWLYAKRAGTEIDGRAAALKARFEGVAK